MSSYLFNFVFSLENPIGEAFAYKYDAEFSP